MCSIIDRMFFLFNGMFFYNISYIFSFFDKIFNILMGKNLIFLIIYIIILVVLSKILYSFVKLIVNKTSQRKSRKNLAKTSKIGLFVCFILIVMFTAIFFYVIQDKNDLATSAEPVSNTSIILEKYPWSSEYLTETYLENLDEKTIGNLRNEIYARHGLIFSDETVNDYFKEKNWYKPLENFSFGSLNDVEKGNISIIEFYMKERGWQGYPVIADNNYDDEVNPVDDYIPDLVYKYDKEYVTEAYLKSLKKESCEILRNEIYARHGYSFKSQNLKNYFLSQSWYKINPDFNEGLFNDIERGNIAIILSHEKKMKWIN